MRRFKAVRFPRKDSPIPRKYIYDRLLLWFFLSPFIILFCVSAVDVFTSEYTFYTEVDCAGLQCDNPMYGDCPGTVERQMPRLCAQEKLYPGTYGEKPEVPLEWLYVSLIGGFVLFFGINHLAWNQNKEGYNAGPDR